MSWVRDSNLTWPQRLAIKIIRSGPIPKHVAFIMDGNRRYANKLHLKSTTDGHVRGFDKLSESLQWCLDIGIKEVTVYAFSIENFKRSKNEVDTLMQLARDKFHKFLEEKDRLNERGICIRIIGNWSLCPIDIQKCMADAVLLTRKNNKAFLNVAFAYTSRDEMTESIKTIVDGVRNNELEVRDINDELIRSCMYSRHSPDPDLLVRTSGESRLSDFLLWQASSSVIYFTDILWPEFTIWHLIAGVFYYQRHHQTKCNVKTSLAKYSNLTKNIIEKVSNEIDSNKKQLDNEINTEIQSNERVKDFLRNLERRKFKELVKLSAIELE